MEIKKKKRTDLQILSEGLPFVLLKHQREGERPVQKKPVEEMTEKFQVWRKPYMFRFKKLQTPNRINSNIQQ